MVRFRFFIFDDYELVNKLWAICLLKNRNKNSLHENFTNRNKFEINMKREEFIHLKKIIKILPFRMNLKKKNLEYKVILSIFFESSKIETLTQRKDASSNP